MSRPAVRNFLHALAAVLGGNLVYFLLVPYLPPAVRHVPSRIDPGMAVDFFLCLILFGIIKAVARRSSVQD